MRRRLEERCPLPARRAKGDGLLGPAPPRSAPRVRYVAPGISGLDLMEEQIALGRLVPGRVWFRGPQRVRIVAVTEETITFAELSHGRAKQRRQSRVTFLHSSRPE